MYIRPDMSEENIQNVQPESTQVIESELAQESLSEIFSQAENTLVEVRTLRQLRYLPTVFMLKTKFGQVEKISLTYQDKLDCSSYISRSGLTFNGCFEFNGDQLKEVKGIYHTPFSPLFSLSFRGKISRDLEEMKNFILKSLDILNVKNTKILITYDNYSFNVFDKYRKGQLYEFEQFAEQGHLQIFSIPMPKYADVYQFREVSSGTIYNHELKFDKNVLAYEPYTRPGVSIILFTNEETKVQINSPDHGENEFILPARKFYLIVHPRPITSRVD